jgi:CO dehydrogenase/acetyl-CoA synthase beta subunit
MDTELIQPRLATNMYIPQELAVKREADARTLVLDRASNCVRSNPTILVWMFLSSRNVGAFARSEEEEEEEEEQEQEHEEDIHKSIREATMALPAALAGSKRKR